MSKIPLLIVLPVIAFIVFLGWAVSGISLLGDDWGHVALATGSLSDLWTTSWVGDRQAGGYYRPVTETSFYLDLLLPGTEARTLHLVNLLLHTLTAVLAGVVSRRLVPGSLPSAVGASLLFLLLPIHASNIFWVVGRGDILCCFFYCLSLVLLPTPRDGSSTGRIVVIGLTSGLCFLSKEMGFTLPVALWVLAWFERGTADRAVRHCLFASVFALFLCSLPRFLVLGSFSGGIGSPSLHQIAYDVLRAGGLIGISSTKWFGVALFSVSVIVFAMGKVTFRQLLPVLLLAACSVAPALGRLHRWYLYLPSVFFVTAVAALWLNNRSRLARVSQFGFVVLLGYYGMTLGGQAMMWRSASRVSGRYLDATAESLRAHAESPRAHAEPPRAHPGRVYLLNVPSSYGGIPVFAHSLAPALRSRDVDPDSLIIVNHVRLLGPTSQTEVEQLESGTFRVSAGQSSFSFHSGPRLPYDDSGAIIPQDLVTAWGRLRIVSAHELVVEITDLRETDYVLSYDGRRYEVFTSDGS